MSQFEAWQFYHLPPSEYRMFTHKEARVWSVQAYQIVEAQQRMKK